MEQIKIINGKAIFPEGIKKLTKNQKEELCKTKKKQMMEKK